MGGLVPHEQGIEGETLPTFGADEGFFLRVGFLMFEESHVRSEGLPATRTFVVRFPRVKFHVLTQESRILEAFSTSGARVPGVRPLVPGQVRLFGVTFPALGADVWSFLLVHLRVPFEKLLILEALSAFEAGERFVALVDFAVPDDVRFPTEILSTIRAHVGLLPSVRSVVVDQLGPAREFFTAFVTDAIIRSLVNLHVMVEKTLTCKTLSTFGARNCGDVTPPMQLQ